MENKEHRSRGKHFTHFIGLKIREGSYKDIGVIKAKFKMGISEIAREAISQYIGRVKADHPDLFKSGD